MFSIKRAEIHLMSTVKNNFDTKLMAHHRKMINHVHVLSVVWISTRKLQDPLCY